MSKKKIPVLEKLNHTSVTPAPFMVLDHSALSKKLSAHKRHLSFLSPGFRDDRRSIEVNGGGSAGMISAISKKFFWRKCSIDWEKKKKLKTSCAQRSPWPHRVSERNQIESPKKLNIKCFSLLRFAVYHLGDFNQHLNKEFAFKDISWQCLLFFFFCTDIFIMFQVDFWSRGVFWGTLRTDFCPHEEKWNSWDKWSQKSLIPIIYLLQ